MQSTGAKTVSLTVAASVLTWGIQMLTTGNPIEGLMALGIGTLIFGGYQAAEETSHSKAYNNIVETVGEDTFTELAELSADELRERLNTDGKAKN